MEANVAIVDFWSIKEDAIKKACEDAGLNYIKLAQDELCILVSRNHPLANHECITIDDLKSYPVSSYKHEVKEYFKDTLLETVQQGDFFDNCEHLKKSLIRKPNAIAVLSKCSVRDDIYLRSGEIVSLCLEDDLQKPITIALLSNKQDLWNQSETIFYQELCDCIKTCFII